MGCRAVRELCVRALEHRVVHRVVLHEALWSDADARHSLFVASARAILLRRLCARAVWEYNG